MPLQPLSEQSIARTMIRLAIPAVFSNIFYMIFEITDMFWVGRLGGQAVAALSSASFFIWMLRALGLTIATGAVALVAQKVGASNGQYPKKTVHYARFATLYFGLLVTLPALFFSRKIFIWLNLPQAVSHAAADYTSVFSLGLVFIFMMQTSEHIIRGMGNTKYPMIVTGISLALNIALDPLFMFTFGMGVSGAALATVLAQVVGAVLMEWVRHRLARQMVAGEVGPLHLFRLREMTPFARIGMPVAFSTAMFSLIYLFLASIIARFGEAPLAAVGIGHRIEALPYFVSLGFAMATSAMVGQNLGAGQIKKARACTLFSLLWAGGLMLLFSGLMYVFARPLYGFFITDPDIIAHGVTYLRIVALFELFLAFELIFEGAFSGAGDTRAPMWILFLVTLLRIPAAYLFAVHWQLGIAAVWWSIALSTLLKGVLLWILFWRRSTRWLSKDLVSEQEGQAKCQGDNLEVTQVQGGIVL